MEKFHRDSIQRSDLDTLTGKRSEPISVLCIQEPKPLTVIGEMKDQPPAIENPLKHKPVVKEMQMEPLQDIVMTRNELKLDNFDPQHPKELIPLNGEGSSGVQDPSTEPKNDSEAKTIKTRCIWCLVDFFREPGDEDPLTRSSAFKCPKCVEEIKQRVYELTQRAGK